MAVGPLMNGRLMAEASVTQRRPKDFVSVQIESLSAPPFQSLVIALFVIAMEATIFVLAL